MEAAKQKLLRIVAIIVVCSLLLYSRVTSNPIMIASPPVTRYILADCLKEMLSCQVAHFSLHLNWLNHTALFLPCRRSNAYFIPYPDQPQCGTLLNSGNWTDYPVPLVYVSNNLIYFNSHVSVAVGCSFQTVSLFSKPFLTFGHNFPLYLQRWVWWSISIRFMQYRSN